MSDVVSENQDVTVWIKSIDSEKGRISLTMKPPPSAAELEAIQAKEASAAAQSARRSRAARRRCRPLSIKKGPQILCQHPALGARRDPEVEGLVHVTEMSDDYNIQPEDFVKVGETVKVASSADGPR